MNDQGKKEVNRRGLSRGEDGVYIIECGRISLAYLVVGRMKIRLCTSNQLIN